MTKTEEIKIIKYTSRTGEIFERPSDNKGNKIILPGGAVDIGRIGYFGVDTITSVASQFTTRTGRKPKLDDIASDLFLSPQLGDVRGGMVVYYDLATESYKRSHTIVEVEVRKE